MKQMKMKTVHAAKTNDRLPGLASEKLVAACDANHEGKALASLDKTQCVEDGGVWFPVDSSWGHRDAVIVFVEA